MLLRFLRRVKNKGIKTAIYDSLVYLKQRRNIKKLANLGVVLPHVPKTAQGTAVFLHSEGGASYKLFLEEPEAVTESFTRDCNYNEKAQVKIIESGIILPLKSIDEDRIVGIGGVYDAEGKFVTRHKRALHISDANEMYPILDKFEYMPETVVYGGLVFNHFGHFLLECLSRMWWFIENPRCTHKYVFVSPEGQPDNIDLLEFYEILGLPKNRIKIIRKPTRFNKIIVPEQTTFIHSGYKPIAATVYDVLRNSVKPAKHKKVYFTRSKLWRTDAVNEAYFENFFRAKGYTIVAPETLTLREQIAIMAGAEEFACISGSLHHHILMGREGIKVIVLNRMSPIFGSGFVAACAWINQLKKADCVYIDVFMNFLPFAMSASVYLVGPTISWFTYVKDTYEEIANENFITNIKIIEYISTWSNLMANIDVNREQHAHTTFADFVINFHRYIYNIELDEKTIQRLNEIYPRHRQ